VGQQVWQRARELTSPDEGHKDAERTVSGLCNTEAALQKGSRFSFHSRHHIGAALLSQQLACHAKAQPAQNTRKHTFWMAIMAHTPFNTCSGTQLSLHETVMIINPVSLLSFEGSVNETLREL